MIKKEQSDKRSPCPFYKMNENAICVLFFVELKFDF